MSEIAILLPTFNGERFLRDQVDSIREQSLRGWRLLIADDGSTDDTLAITQQLTREDPRISIVPTTGNLGQKRRLRQLAAAAQADLIAIADQDDSWRPDKLALLRERLGDNDMAFGASELTDAAGRSLNRLLTDALPPRHLPGERFALIFRPWVSAHAMLTRRHLLNDGNFGRWLPFDWMMSIEAAFGRGVVFVPEAVTMHRMHDSNQANGEFIDQQRPQRLVSRDATRLARRVRDGTRWHFMRVAERMAHADGVAADVQDRFIKALSVCYDSWFGRWHEKRMTPAETMAALTDLLRPIAGHDADWRYAELRLRALCLSPYAPSRFLNRHRLLQHERTA